MDSTNTLLRIAGLVNDSITDGPGFRFTVFTQGCPHHCDSCHNPQTWDFEAGYDIDITEIYEKIKSNPLIKGVTFSGGEPLCQPKPLAILAKMLKNDGYEIAVYTGFLTEELIADGTSAEYELVSNVDIIVDGRFEKDKRNIDLRFKGSENQRIINVKETLKKGEIVLETSERWTGISKF